MEELINTLKFDASGLIPAVVQNIETNEVLMVAYMNADTIKQTLETGRATFWSRSRQEVWVKGDTSGNYMYVKEVRVDCDCDCLVVLVNPAGPACHTGNRSCFFRKIEDGKLVEDAKEQTKTDVFAREQAVVMDRKEHPEEGSYTNYLFDKGEDKILKKVGEESAEVIIAGKADGAENVVRVKAAVRNFAAETNLTVITEDGGFFTFDVYYAENPVVSTLNLTVQEPQPESMKKPAAVGYPQPTAPASEGRVLLREVGREKPATIKRMLNDIYRQNRTDVKGIRTKKYGIGVEVLGIYVFNDVIYIHSCISNDTNISFEVDARRFIVADRKLAKRTAQQQSTLEILRVCNDPAVVRGHQRQRTVFALPKLTISDDKVLLLEIIEKNGARHQTVEIPAEELLEAKLL